MPSRIPKLARRGIVVLAVLLLALGTGLATARHAGVQVAFLGDSYTWGYGASERGNGYAYVTARAEHWRSEIVGLPGAGYARYSVGAHKRIADGIRAVVAAHPRLLIVECGHNDSRPTVPVAATAANALRDLEALRVGLPHTKIVVIGPVWLDGFPPRRALQVRDVVHAAQRRIPNSRWIDPIAERWFTGDYRERTGDDSTMINFSDGHPDDAGYAHMARRLEADLRRLGV